ncbi:MAG: Hsp70 family protein [Lactobacillales bacterium]|jgi:hypothetical chaperone protein|nr:Hsp70 family protein [Lactobacillales bacterium]
MKHTCTAAGIDFGTSNSSVSFISKGKAVQMVPLEDGKNTLPTTLFFEQESKNILFGTAALEAFCDRTDGRLMRSIKRLLGSPLMAHTTLVNGRLMKFDRIIGFFLKHLKDKLEHHIQADISGVSIGRPVFFRDNNPAEDALAQTQLHQIAQSVGFKNISFQFEPIAAAFAHEQDIIGENLACVIDIGGGTSDFTLIKIGAKLKNKLDRSDDILANTGVRVGGNDFDKMLSLHSFMPALGKGTRYGDKDLPVPNTVYADLSEWSHINFAYTGKTLAMVRDVLMSAHDPHLYRRLEELIVQERGHALLNTVEESKIELTQRGEIKKSLSFLSDKPDIHLTETQFNNDIASIVHKIRTALINCLKTANIDNEDVDLVILTGGSTQVPLVKQIVSDIFPQARLSEKNKFCSVGEGLAYDSQRKHL